MAKMKPYLPRAAYFSAIACEEAMTQFILQIGEAAYKKLRVGFLSGNTIGGMDLSEHFYDDFLRDKSSGHLSDVVYHEWVPLPNLLQKN
jgi:3-oxoacyl-[acyl-carrier-protein] synthase-1